MRLIATAPTKERMTAIINSYFYSTKYAISDNLEILHPDKQITNYKVIAKGKRIRFEEI